MTVTNTRNLWIDYLRSALTVLVVAHHSSLAYTSFASFDKVAYIRSTHAIVDDSRWIGLDIFENFNDIFFMSLMFLIGGLFLFKSVERKGTGHFIKDRIYRLFLPFLLGGTLLMLIAYYPSYIVATGSGNILNYVYDFFTKQAWPVGPPWFLWVLFAFNILFVILFPLVTRTGGSINAFFVRITQRPFNFFLLIFVLTWLLYVPVAYSIGAGTWTGIGPFDFQLSRVLLYFGYFMLGAFIGTTNFNNQLFSSESPIIKHWLLWVILAAFVYGVLTVTGEIKLLGSLVQEKKISAFSGWMIYYTMYSLSCTLSSIAFITSFRYWANSPRKWWNSLTENAYLIYLVHYVFVTWIQFFLLSIEMPALIKFFITFIGALFLSWILAAQLRKINYIKRYL